MATDRRDFFSTVMALGAVPALLEMLPAVAQAQAAGATADMDLDTYKFWTQSVRTPSLSFAQTGRLPLARGIEETEILYYSTDTGFVRSTDPQLDKLLLPKGDTNMSVSMDTLRPAAAHIKLMRNSGSGSLRLDLKQAKPLPQLWDTLNWSSIGTLTGSGSDSAPFQSLTYDPKSTWGNSKLVPLVDGVGFWAWNLNVQAGQSRFAQMLTEIGSALSGAQSAGVGAKGSGSKKASVTGNVATAANSASTAGGAAASPLISSTVKSALTLVGIGLPSIASTALHVVDFIYGFLSSQGGGKPQAVFQMQDQVVLATQDARQTYAGRAVHLISGQYLIVPSLSVKDLLAQNYKILDYALVPTAATNAEKDEAMASTLVDVPYAVVSVGISPA
jgi:hypothetical protein